jgi:hypothetical protein
MACRCTTCVRINLVLPLDVHEVGEKEKFDLDQYIRNIKKFLQRRSTYALVYMTIEWTWKLLDLGTVTSGLTKGESYCEYSTQVFGPPNCYRDCTSTRLYNNTSRYHCLLWYSLVLDDKISLFLIGFYTFFTF